MVCIKALKKFQVRVAGCHKLLPPRKENFSFLNFAPGKYFDSVFGLRQFDIVYMRSLHYDTIISVLTFSKTRAIS